MTKRRKRRHRIDNVERAWFMHRMLRSKKGVSELKRAVNNLLIVQQELEKIRK